MVETKRKDNESFESLVRRFNRQVVQSGRLLQAKKVRFFKRDKSTTVLRSSAQHRATVKANMEYLRKIGKLVEPTPRRRGFNG
jgi:ribosomal protein S21